MTPQDEGRKNARDVRVAERLADLVSAKIDVPTTASLSPDVMSTLIEIRDNTDLTNAVLREILKELRKKPY